MNGSRNDMVSLWVNMRKEELSGSKTIPGDLRRGRRLEPTSV